MSLNLDAKKSEDVETSIRFSFPDTREVILLHVRRGVCEVVHGASHTANEEVDIAVKLDSTVWREILVGGRNVAAAYLKSEFVLEKGTSIQLASFLLLFKTPS